MKLLFVAARFHTNQAPFARALVERGHEVVFDVVVVGATEDHTVVTPNVMPTSWFSKLLVRLRNPDNLVWFHAEHTFPSLVWYVRRLRSLAPDVVVIREPNRPSSVVAAIAARLTGTRAILYTQGPVHAKPQRGKRLLRGLLIAALDASWFSPVLGDTSLPPVHPDVHYLPFVADQGRAPKTRWYQDDRVNILSIGKFTPRKNHLLLIDAFDELRREHDAHLTLVGEVSNAGNRRHHAQVLERIAERGLNDAITVLTNVPFSDIGNLYVVHDVFVLPSRNEPVAVSLLEAMAHGLPVICSTTAGCQWYIEPGGNGFVFRSNDLHDLTAKLTTIVADRVAAQRMGARSRALAESVHHPDTVCEAFFQIVHSGRRRVSSHA